MLRDHDTCTALIDWNTAGVGDPGRQPRQSAHAHVPAVRARRTGPRAGRRAKRNRYSGDHVIYWDGVAALNTPAFMDGPDGFDHQGESIGDAAVTKRRHAFLLPP